MNTTLVNHGRKALTVKVALAALLAACVALVFGANNAKAMNAGDPFNAEFQYAGLNVDVTLAQLDEMVLDGTGDSLLISGTYSNSNGDLTLPKNTGLTFPQILLPLTEGVDLNANIELASDGTGNYNPSTGVMSLELPVALTIGVSDVSALPIPGLGSGPLTCKFSPINISLSTENGWPHDGYAFADPATVENGALAGAWRSKPPVTAVEGAQATCDLIGGVLKDVGGLWLANSTTPLSSMPAATSSKPSVETCEEHGQVGTFPDCETPVTECDPGFEGTPPNCTKILSDGKVGSLTITKKATVKAGKSVKIKVTVKNTGEKTLKTKLTLSSSNKKVAASPKSVSLSIAGGKSITKTITVKAAPAFTCPYEDCQKVISVARGRSLRIMAGRRAKW